MFLPGYSEIYLTWLTGIRLLVEGSVIEPYIFGEQGLRYSILHTCRDLAKAEKGGGAPSYFWDTSPYFVALPLFNIVLPSFLILFLLVFGQNWSFNALELFVNA